MEQWVCYVTPRLPWPPNSGAERRVYQHLVMLRSRYRVCLVTSAKRLPGTGDDALQELRELVDDLVVAPLASSAVSGASGLLHLWPLQVVRAYEVGLHEALRNAEQRHQSICTIYSLVRTGPYMDGRRSAAVIDFCDALSEQFRQRVAFERFPLRSVYRLEALLLGRYEALLGKLADTTLITTTEHAGSLRGDTSPIVIPTTHQIAEPLATGEPVEVPGHPVIIFTGDMSTQYSERAAMWLAEQVLPLVRRRLPDVRFVIVGRSPTDRLLRLASESRSIAVTGQVASVAEYLKQADVAVVPLQFGTGVKNKMLEAFAQGVPVVATPVADKGMGAAGAGAVTLADSPETFAEAVVALVEDVDRRDRQVERAQIFVNASYGRARITHLLLRAVDQSVERFTAKRGSTGLPAPE